MLIRDGQDVGSHQVRTSGIAPRIRWFVVGDSFRGLLGSDLHDMVGHIERRTIELKLAGNVELLRHLQQGLRQLCRHRQVSSSIPTNWRSFPG
jgi:hypothetical protein